MSIRVAQSDLLQYGANCVRTWLRLLYDSLVAYKSHIEMTWCWNKVDVIVWLG